MVTIRLTCEATGKRKYGSRAVAESEAMFIHKRDGHVSPGRMTPYTCSHCGRWHLTTNQTYQQYKADWSAGMGNTVTPPD